MRPQCSSCKASEKDIFRFPSLTAKPQQVGLLTAAHKEKAEESSSKLTTHAVRLHKTQSQLCLKSAKQKWGGGDWKKICQNFN